MQNQKSRKAVVIAVSFMAFNYDVDFLYHSLELNIQKHVFNIIKLDYELMIMQELIFFKFYY